MLLNELSIYFQWFNVHTYVCSNWLQSHTMHKILIQKIVVDCTLYLLHKLCCRVIFDEEIRLCFSCKTIDILWVVLCVFSVVWTFPAISGKMNSTARRDWRKREKPQHKLPKLKQSYKGDCGLWGYRWHGVTKQKWSQQSEGRSMHYILKSTEKKQTVSQQRSKTATDQHIIHMSN